MTETPCRRGSAISPLDLLVGGVDVLVGARGEAGVVEDLLHRLGRFGALRRVLEQDRVADHQVRPGEAGDLVVGEVPGHDPEQDPEGAAADDRGALAGESLDRLVGHQVLGVVGVEGVDVAREVDLAERLLDRLAHLADDDLGQLLAALLVQLADLAHERGAVGHGGGGGQVREASSARPIAARSSSSEISGYSLTVSPVAGLTTA